MPDWMPDWIKAPLLILGLILGALAVLSVPAQFFVDRRCSACRQFSKRRTGASRSRGGLPSRTESEFKCKLCGQAHWTIDPIGDG